MRQLTMGGVAGAVLVLAACSGRSTAPSVPGQGKPAFEVASSTSCARVKPGVGARRAGAVRQSS
ncbi:MAG: hypothetical protein EOO74_11790, partial [Myxococcales bacterium]